jgi:hypothetical protein
VADRIVSSPRTDNPHHLRERFDVSPRSDTVYTKSRRRRSGQHAPHLTMHALSFSLFTQARSRARAYWTKKQPVSRAASNDGDAAFHSPSGNGHGCLICMRESEAGSPMGVRDRWACPAMHGSRPRRSREPLGLFRPAFFVTYARTKQPN